MAELYCFGRFTLNPESRKLLADGVPTPVGSTAVRILLALVEQAGQIVSKDDLMSRVWGPAGIGDNRLHVHVYQLRKTIGDDSIVTKSGGGYRFVAPVERRSAQAQIQSSPPRNGNLPSVQTDGPTGLIGRNEELRAVSQRLLEGRLVTLTGPGGVGKTSLALHVAAASASHFPDGVWLAELATLNDPALVPAAVATLLGIKLGQSAAPLDTLVRHLTRKKLLLVLDNCEHVLSAAALLAEAFVRTAPDVKILATSRESLSCAGEEIFHVPPLALPPDGGMPPQSMRDMAAIRLFIERARSADSRFLIEDHEIPVAARICRRLDGLPLAIEMASGWVGALGLEALDAKLDGSLKAWLRARGTAPPRHSTLRATLEWSHDLLSLSEQVVLRRLAVFAAGFTMNDAEAVASGDGIVEEAALELMGSLIRKSMVAVTPGSRAQRYRLMETTRAFALEKLTSSGDAGMSRGKHARLMLRTLEHANHEWEHTSDTVWLDRYRPIQDDARAALDWALGEEPELAIAIAGASWPLWREFALHAEGRQRLAAAAEHLRADTPSVLEARLRRGLGELWTNSGAVNRARDEFARAVELYRTPMDPARLGAALSRQAFALIILRRDAEAEQCNREALRLLSAAETPRALASAYAAQVCVEARLGRYEQAREEGAKAIRLCSAIGAERLELVVAGNLMEFALERDDIDDAMEIGRTLTARLRDSAHSDVEAFVLGLMVAALTFRGDLDEALIMARQAVPFLREEGALFGLFDHLALRTGLVGRLKDATQLTGYSDAAYQASGRPREPIGKRAAIRIDQLLRETLPESEIVLLKSEGALLTEDHATALALSE